MRITVNLTEAETSEYLKVKEHSLLKHNPHSVVGKSLFMAGLEQLSAEGVISTPQARLSLAADKSAKRTAASKNGGKP